MTSFFKKISLLISVTLFPTMANAHLIGGHSHVTEATHSALGLEHFFLAGVVGFILYSIIKKLS